MIMEHFYLSLVFFIVLFIVVSLHFTFNRKYIQKFRQNVNFPPGRFGLPYIGETLKFASARRNGHPEKFIFDRVSTYSSSIFKTSILTEPTVFFCDAPGNKFLFSNENKLVTTWLPDSVNKISRVASAKEEAKSTRKMMTHNTFLKAKELQRHIAIMDDMAQRHFMIDWENRDKVVVWTMVKKFTFWVACKLFMSVEDTDRVAEFAEPISLITSGLLSIPIDLPGTPLNKAVKASDFIQKKLMDIIKQRKLDLANGNATPTQDMLSYLLLTTDENGTHMTEPKIAMKILGMIVGSHDTTTSVCTFVVKYLAELPHIYEGVYHEQMEIAKMKAPGELLNWDDLQKMRYTWNVVCEVMRLTPASQGAFREAITDFTYNGFKILKGWKLYWSTDSTHKNPEYFPEPEKFDPSRFDGKGPAPYTYVPFGGGPHICPGKEYARLKILVFIHNLVKRFRWEKVLQEEKITINLSPEPAKGLPILLYSHEA